MVITPKTNNMEEKNIKIQKLISEFAISFVKYVESEWFFTGDGYIVNHLPEMDQDEITIEEVYSIFNDLNPKH